MIVAVCRWLSLFAPDCII